jgi:hypothetical protein
MSVKKGTTSSVNSVSKDKMKRPEPIVIVLMSAQIVKQKNIALSSRPNICCVGPIMSMNDGKFTFHDSTRKIYRPLDSINNPCDKTQSYLGLTDIAKYEWDASNTNHPLSVLSQIYSEPEKSTNVFDIVTSKWILNLSGEEAWMPILSDPASQRAKLPDRNIKYKDNKTGPHVEESSQSLSKLTDMHVNDMVPIKLIRVSDLQKLRKLAPETFSSLWSSSFDNSSVVPPAQFECHPSIEFKFIQLNYNNTPTDPSPPVFPGASKKYAFINSAHITNSNTDIDATYRPSAVKNILQYLSRRSSSSTSNPPPSIEHNKEKEKETGGEVAEEIEFDSDLLSLAEKVISARNDAVMIEDKEEENKRKFKENQALAEQQAKENLRIQAEAMNKRAKDKERESKEAKEAKEEKKRKEKEKADSDEKERIRLEDEEKKRKEKEKEKEKEKADSEEKERVRIEEEEKKKKLEKEKEKEKEKEEKKRKKKEKEEADEKEEKKKKSEKDKERAKKIKETKKKREEEKANAEAKEKEKEKEESYSSSNHIECETDKLGVNHTFHIPKKHRIEELQPNGDHKLGGGNTNIAEVVEGERGFMVCYLSLSSLSLSHIIVNRQVLSNA